MPDTHRPTDFADALPHTQTPRDRRGRGKWLVIGIATALLLVAAGASIWFRAQDLPNAGTVDGAQQTQELPSEAAVVGHWVGSCDAVFSSGSTQDVQLTYDLTQDGTFIRTINGEVVVGSYTLPEPEHMQVTGTIGGKTTTTDFTIVSLTGSRMQLHWDTNGNKTDCSFAKSGPPQAPIGPTNSRI